MTQRPANTHEVRLLVERSWLDIWWDRYIRRIKDVPITRVAHIWIPNEWVEQAKIERELDAEYGPREVTK